MPLDPSIIAGIKPAQFDLSQFSPMNAMTNVMKFRQADEESQLNALKRQEAQAALTERNALRGLDPTAADYESQLFKVNPKLGFEFRKEKAATGASAAAQTKSEFDLKAAQRTFFDKLKLELSDNPSDANVVAFGQDAELQGLYTPAQVKTTVDQLLAMPPPQRVALLAKAGLSASERKPPAPAAPPSMVAEYNFAKSPEGGNFKGDYQSFVTARAAAGRAPAPPRPEQPPIAVVGPDGKSIYVSREEALRNRMTPAPTAGQDAKPLNENQANATAYGLRMKEANSILEDLAEKGVLKGAVIERTPLIGRALGQSLPSVLGGTSSAQQQVNQAKSNFITAVLRKESGAVISDSEFEREDQKYFPQINDNKEVIKQKEKARKLAIQAIEVQAGPGAKNIREYNPRAGAAGAGVDTSNPLLR
jgi:hypothetical protein